MEGMKYSTVSEIAGPLIIVEGVKEVGYGEIVKIESHGERRMGQVLEAAEGRAVIQVFEGTRGLDTKATSVTFTGKPMEIGVSMEMLGRIFDGKGMPIDANHSAMLFMSCHFIITIYYDKPLSFVFCCFVSMVNMYGINKFYQSEVRIKNKFIT